jgi:hypothetical protein
MIHIAVLILPIILRIFLAFHGGWFAKLPPMNSIIQIANYSIIILSAFIFESLKNISNC